MRKRWSARVTTARLYRAVRAQKKAPRAWTRIVGFHLELFVPDPLQCMYSRRYVRPPAYHARQIPPGSETMKRHRTDFARNYSDRGCADMRAAARRVNRRQVLQAGGLAALGLGLPQLFAARALADASPLGRGPGFGRAKRCIFLFMWGGPSQLDTFDMKPEAPAEIRGTFRPIATRVPGIQICEHFTGLAQHTDKVAFVRSLNHTDPAHLSSGHATLTGHLAPKINSDADPPSERDTPHLGSVLARLRETPDALPPFVTLPWKAYHPSAPAGRPPGNTAASWAQVRSAARDRRPEPARLEGPGVEPRRRRELRADRFAARVARRNRPATGRPGIGRHDGAEGKGVRPAGVARCPAGV